MAGEPTITVIGNLAGDPELRFTQSGAAVANFTIAQTPRNFNRETNQWVDDETLWVRASVWREAAENVAETLVKGMRVVATGRLKARSFEDKEGNNRTNWELDIDEIGPSLKWATAQVVKSQGGNGGFGGNNGGGFGGPQGGNNGFGGAQGGGQWGQPQGNPQGGQWGQPQAQPQGQPQGQPPVYPQQPQGNPQGYPQQGEAGPQGGPQGAGGNVWQGGNGGTPPPF